MTINELAVEYVNSGWSVLPVRPDEKRPYMTNWLQYTKTRANKSTVENWVYLIGIELYLFKPYYQILEDKKYKVKLNSKYCEDIFPSKELYT